MLIDFFDGIIVKKKLQSLLAGQVKVYYMDSMFSKIADLLMSLNLSSMFVQMFATPDR